MKTIIANLLFTLTATTLNFGNAYVSNANSNSTNSIYFIGDLHGDMECARHWVTQTNLIDLTTTPFTWKGSNCISDGDDVSQACNNEQIVFMGDYVDKGTQSRGVLEFIRKLHATFPRNIIPLLGNHDFYMLLDATLEAEFAKQHHPMGQFVHEFTYAFAHPEEYTTAGWSEERKDDVAILQALHGALQSVYTRGLHGNTFMCGSEPSKSSCRISNSRQNVDLFANSAAYFFLDNHHNHGSKKEVENTSTVSPDEVRTRLSTWREDYSKGLLESGLLHWLSQLPVIATVGDALVVHGGLSSYVLDYLAKHAASNDIAISEVLNDLVHVPFHKFWDSILDPKSNATISGPNVVDKIPQDVLTAIDLMGDIVTYRGYFKQDGAREVQYILDVFNNDNGGAEKQFTATKNRIVVGHTPHQFATEFYDGKLLANDSSLSRTFRAFGNLYCPVRDSVRKLNIKEQSGCARRHSDVCEGSISHLHRTSNSDAWPEHVVHIHSQQKRHIEDARKEEL